MRRLDLVDTEISKMLPEPQSTASTNNEYKKGYKSITNDEADERESEFVNPVKPDSDSGGFKKNMP